MADLWLPALAILAGFGGLVWSADRFVGGSAAIANNFGRQPLGDWPDHRLSWPLRPLKLWYPSAQH